MKLPGHLLLLTLSLMMLAPAPTFAADKAKELFDRYRDRIYQIRVIDLVSGNKASIGSGFQITARGHIATNYHVIAEALHNPRQYRIEYMGHDGQTGPLTITDIDVVHDLAVIFHGEEGSSFFELAELSPQKGNRIYSLGNPLDLGMSIVEGTFNGLLEKSLREKILFSGSLNPGMSGGPALNSEGEVIGINVSTAGNDISFLVPVRHLRRLKEAVREKEVATLSNMNNTIEGQLIDHQGKHMEELLAASWPHMDLGRVKAPGKMADHFKCWGNSDHDEEALHEHTYSVCESTDTIFISSRFTTGAIYYRYDWYKAGQLSTPRFYNLYQKTFRNVRSNNRAGKEDVTNFSCNTDFIQSQGKDWKLVFCARNYKKYPRLYDLSLSMALVSEYKRGLLVNVDASGVSKKMALDFSKKIVESIRWTN